MPIPADADLLARRHWEIEVYFNQLVELHLDYCLMDTDTSGVAERARRALMENMETMATKMTVWALFQVYEAYCRCVFFIYVLVTLIIY